MRLNPRGCVRTLEIGRGRTPSFVFSSSYVNLRLSPPFQGMGLARTKDYLLDAFCDVASVDGRGVHSTRIIIPSNTKIRAV
jgi:hypothetical protein